MAQTQVSLRNNITNPYNNSVTTQAYAVAPNANNSNIVSLGVNGSSGVLNSYTNTQVPGAPPTYGLVLVNTTYAYGTEGNTLYQYNTTNTAPGLTYTGVSWDMTNPTYNGGGYGFPFINATDIPATSNNLNIFSEPLQIISGGTDLTATGNVGTVDYTVTTIFGTTSFLTVGENGNIYALLPDSRIARIVLTNNAPTSMVLITQLPVLENVTTSSSFGLTYLTGYLYTYDGSTQILNYVNATTGAIGRILGTGVPGEYSATILPINSPGGTVSSYTNLDTGIEYLFIAKYVNSGFYQIDIAQMATKTTVAYLLERTYAFQEKAISTAILGNVLYLLSSNTPVLGGPTYYNTYQLSISFSATPICFLKGTYIYTKEGYKQIENLKKGDLVNTFKDNYVAIDTIIEEEMYHDASKPRNKGQLFKLDYPEYPQILKELYITGAHSILVGKLTEKQKEQILKDYGKTFATDLFDRLPAYIDEKAKVHEESGMYTIYHLALENENMYSNYGIFANGLLVESLSKNDCVNRIY